MIRFLKFLSIPVILFLATACQQDDPPLPDNTSNFEASVQGFEGTETTIKVKLDRAAEVSTPITVSFQATRLNYSSEFSISQATGAESVSVQPDKINGTIALNIPAGSDNASFKVSKLPAAFFNGDESISFKIASIGQPAIIGKTSELKLSFTAITSQGSQLTLEGKTSSSPYANSVYADLSANKQNPVNRKSWNLGFSGGSQFRIVLNPAYQTTAAATTKTDINSVTLADADLVLNLDHDISNPATSVLSDAWTGELNKTVFAEVSANTAENKVYLVSFEGSKSKDQWYKVKVNRNGENYKVQYAKIGETTIKTIDVNKNADYNFSFLSLENNTVVEVEPRKNNWDIQWSYSTYNSGLNTPYWFQDFVLINHLAGVQAAEVLEATVKYEDFTEANLASATWLGNRDAIGSKWRSTAPGGTTGIKRDRYYLIKDSQANVYKLKFVSMGLGNDGGERGRPVIEYKLVKKGN